MSRIPYPPEASELPDVQPSGARTLNVERMMMHLTPRLRETFGNLGKAVLWEGSLDPKLRELALVRLGRLSDAPYEVFHHEAIARQFGVTDEQLASLGETKPGAEFTPCERTILDFTDEVVRDVRPSDAMVDRILEYLNPSELMELIVAIGVYMTVCRILETFGVDMDDFSLDNTPR